MTNRDRQQHVRHKARLTLRADMAALRETYGPGYQTPVMFERHICARCH